MIDFLYQIGLSKFDLIILFGSPLMGLTGAFAHSFFIDVDLDKSPKLEYSTKIKKEENIDCDISLKSKTERGYWIASRVILGTIVGFAIGLFFIGTLSSTITSISKILLISLIGGFVSHKILNYLNASNILKILKKLDNTE